MTRFALRMTPHVFVQPGELRRAEWSEFDFDRATWSIPAEKMKMRWFCLALAIRNGLPAWTADKVWRTIADAAKADVVVIR